MRDILTFTPGRIQNLFADRCSFFIGSDLLFV